MSRKKPSGKDEPNSRIVARNRKARHEYDVLDELECGIVLQGSEVKSLRNGKISIEEAYARVRNGELWLIGCDIAEYPQATTLNHEPKRPRKLLVHKRELRKFAEAADDRGLTLIPLSVYFSKGRVKVNVALARGRKLHDKRDKLKREADRREIRQALLPGR
ncbi:MAG TPA: SsrA-binding protein SmpB [Planctomycetaceae bacterium]|nr:SsrA-binding protein SmpB [Planctomycetaceae bacterium]